MRKLVCSISLSLDGYVRAAGDPDRVVPDEERNRHFDDIERETDTLLDACRMNDLMAGYWPTADEDPSAQPGRGTVRIGGLRIARHWHWQG